MNKRDDEYGGSVENRMRLLGEVLDRVSDVFKTGSIGVRLSPLGQTNDISDSDPESLFSAVIDIFSQRKLAYLHLIDEFYGANTTDGDRDMLGRLRARFDGVYFGNGGYDSGAAADAIRAGEPTPFLSAVHSSPIPTCRHASAETRR